jgi:hypothetical protein
MAYRSRQRRNVRASWQWDRPTWMLIAFATLLLLVVLFEMRRASTDGGGEGSVTAEAGKRHG